MIIDTLLYEQTLKENADKIKEMDAVKLHRDRMSISSIYVVVICLKYDIPLAVQKPNLFRNVIQADYNINVRCFDFNGRIISKKLTGTPKLSNMVYVKSAKHSIPVRNIVIVK